MRHVVRSSLKVGLGLGLAILLFGCQTSPPTDRTVTHNHDARAQTNTQKRTHDAQTKFTSKAALDELRAGNQRFATGKSRDRYWPEEVRLTAAHQYPSAVIVSCMDSRVSPEIIFDQGLGDVFSVRVAGNVLNDDIVGSVEYACKEAGAKLIVVLGHSNCGAIKGAIDDVSLGNVTGLLKKIKPAEQRVAQSVQPRTSKNKKFVQQVAQTNVRLVVQQIRERSPVLRDMLDAGQIGLTGAMYDVVTGEVSFMTN